MSIIGKGFDDDVINQINIRQKKIGQYSKDIDLNRYLTSKTAFLRLTSGVNITDNTDGAEKLTDLGIPAGDHAKFQGNALAKQFVISSAYFDGEFTSNVGYALNSSYGFYSNSDYGYSPPPGIISATIKSLNRGSIREATIELTCHNLAQFKVISTLFLKLRYSLLLEWGHTLYYDQNGVLQGSDSVPNLSQSFLDALGKQGQDSILQAIKTARKNTNMNYDAFFGIVKNYNWDLLSNGSYKITVNAISTGEVIESLKINANVTPDKTAEGNTPQFQKSTLHKLMGNVVALVTENAGAVNGYGAGSSLNSPALASYSGIEYNHLISGDDNSASSPNGVLANNEGALVIFNNIEPTKYNNSTTQYYIKLGALLRIIQAFNLYYDTNASGNPPVFKINTNFNDNKCLTIPNHASLDPGVCVIALDLDTTVAESAGLAGGLPYLKTTTVYDYSGFAQYTNGIPSYTYDTFPTQEYVADLANFTLGKEIITDVSASNLPDIFRTQTVNGLFPIGGELGSNSIPQDDIEARLGPIENSILNSPSIGQAGFDPNVLYFGNVKITTVTYQTAPTDSGSIVNTNVLKKNIDKEFRTTDSLVGNMMHIYVNINFITATLDNNTDASTGKISVFDFLKKLLDGIKASLGYINDFKVIYEHDDNMYHIIDDSYLAYAYDKSSPTSAKFNINLLKSDNGSFVTKFGLKSDLFAKTANAAAMGAQTNGNTLISNSVPFSRFNEGLIDRTIPKKRNKNTDDDPKQDFSDKYTTAYIDYFTFLTEVYGNGNASRAVLDQYRSSVKDLFEFDLAYYTEQSNTPGTYLIPLNLNLTLEGLSGVDLLQTFTIDETLLPDEYYNRIRFITKGISHKIDSRGWETSLETFSLPKLGSSLNTSVKRPKKVEPKRGGGGRRGKYCKDFLGDKGEACGAASQNTVDTVYPRTKLYRNGPMDVLVKIENQPSVAINLRAQPSVSYQKTILTGEEYIRYAEDVIDKMIPNAPKDKKLLILISAFTTSRLEQASGDYGFKGFNNNISGVEKSGFKVFNASDVVGKVNLKEGGTGIYKDYYAFSTPSAGLVPLIEAIVNRNMFDTGGGPNEYAWRRYRDWNGYGAQTTCITSNCIPINRSEKEYIKFRNYVTPRSKYK